MTKFPYHQYLDLSSARRVFVSGDVHGEYTLLKEKLDELEFDSALGDKLVLTGDLVDRGPQSHLYSDWIHQDFVHRTLGNHDVAPQMVLDYQLERWVYSKNYGGDWFLALSKADQEAVASELLAAPVALTIRTPAGYNVGICHADCSSNWASYVTSLDNGNISTYDLSLWSRETIKDLMKIQETKRRKALLNPDSQASYIIKQRERALVKGIDHVFHGHTVLAEPFRCANRSWIDTGACFGNRLTILDVDEYLDKIST